MSWLWAVDAEVSRFYPHRRAAIDGNVDRALGDPYRQVQGSRERVGNARGVLVFPDFVQAGFIVGGGTGEGALREGGRTTSYHRMATGSFGWLAGVDAGISVLNVGATGRVDTASGTQAVNVYVLTHADLMADVSVDGSRITRLEI